MSRKIVACHVFTVLTLVLSAVQLTFGLSAAPWASWLLLGFSGGWLISRLDR